MNLKKIVCATSVLAASIYAQADIKVGVITSSSGPIAMVGIPQKNTIDLLPKKNRQ